MGLSTHWHFKFVFNGNKPNFNASILFSAFFSAGETHEVGRRPIYSALSQSSDTRWQKKPKCWSNRLQLGNGDARILSFCEQNR